MMKDRLISYLNKINGQEILVVGDIMLDHYQWGHVERISPEAPVPVVSVYKETYLLGGAGNVARNIKSLGGEPMLITLIANDRAGEKIKELLIKEKINAHFVTSSNRPTTIKTRILAQNQQIVRIDHENTQKLESIEVEEFNKQIKKLSLGKYVVVSDYGKGFIGEHTFKRLKNKKVVLDPKTGNADIYKNLFIITPNKKETEELSRLKIQNKEKIIVAGRFLMEKKQLKNLLITLGPEGMILFQNDGLIFHIPTCAQKVYDVTGAGDTVIAMLALCLTCGIDLLHACCLANYAAGIVVGQVGTATTTQQELIQTIQKLEPPKIARLA
jgi:rfaE bifunctional protein kinase chain/domain